MHCRATLFFALLPAISLSSKVCAQQFGPGSAILDNAGVVDARTEAQLNRWLLELQQKTGAQVRVLTIRSTGDRDIYDYASDVFRRQNNGKGLGDGRGSNNGLLIVIAVDDKKWRFHVGEGLEGAVPDAYTDQVAQQVFKPNFRKGDFGRGVLHGTMAVAQRIAADANVQLSGVPRGSAVRYAPGGRRRVRGFACFWPLLLIVMLGGGLFGRRRRGYTRTWGGGGLWQGMLLGSLLGGLGRGGGGWSGGGGFGGGGLGGGGFGGGGFGGGGGSFGGGGSTGGW